MATARRTSSFRTGGGSSAAAALAVLAAGLCGPTPSRAQGGPTGTHPNLVPVDQRYEDVGPLGVSLRHLQPDYRVPLDFERVYRVGPATFTGEDRFARVSGALAAVFPRSEYRNVKKGVVADVPAGTIFYIGGIPRPAFPHQTRPSNSTRPPALNLNPDGRVLPLKAESSVSRLAPVLPSPGPADARADTPREPGYDLTRRGTPSMLDDDDFRAARVGELLQTALRARAAQAHR